MIYFFFYYGGHFATILPEIMGMSTCNVELRVIPYATLSMMAATLSVNTSRRELTISNCIAAQLRRDTPRLTTWFSLCATPVCGRLKRVLAVGASTTEPHLDSHGFIGVAA